MTKAKVTDFKQHKANANKGSERGEYMIETSLREVGAWRSVGADRNGTIGVGNKTTQKWQEIANPDDVIVVPTDGTKLVIVQRTDLDFDSDDPAVVERTIKAAYFDNRASEVSMTWDAEQVLADITAGVDLESMFKQDELEELLKDLLPKTEGDAEPQIDRAAELNEVWQVQPGDVWQIGEHRLVCGDCTDPAIVAKVMGGEKASYAIQDPPYGISVVGGSKSFGTVGGSKSFGTAGGSNIVRSNVYAPIVGDDKPYDPTYILSICPNSVLWGANYYADKLPAKRGWLVWDKKGKEWDDNFSDCELAWTPFDIPTKIYRHVWMGIVQEGKREIRQHPTQKPSELYQKIISELFTDDGIIIDFYLGSGTTLVACQNLGRRGRGIEVSPAYCAVILQRMQDAFGLVGVRIDSQVNT